MDLIESLSEDLAGELREQRKGKLQRTFVAASDAAEAKAKRCKYIFFKFNLLFFDGCFSSIFIIINYKCLTNDVYFIIFRKLSS